MKFNVTAGGHGALVDLFPDGKGNFSGTIKSPDFGEGAIAGVITGDHYTGSIILDGHTAKFEATLYDNGGIAGTITAGWFFSQDFMGKAA